MKAKIIFIILTILYALLGCPFSDAALGQDTKDIISSVKLSQESLPQDIRIARELWASRQQLTVRRIKLGFPLNALLNQTVLYDMDQASVNYLLPPGEDWLEFGYSKLSHTDGNKSLIVKKGPVIIQVAASSQDMEDRVIQLLEPDILHFYKIKMHRLPKNWVLTEERELGSEELRRFEQKAKGPIKEAIAQEFIINREAVNITYFDCGEGQIAESVARRLAEKKTPIVKRLVKLSGSVVVVVDSQNEHLNEDIMAQVNWR